MANSHPFLRSPFLTLKDTPGLSCVFWAPALESTTFPRTPDFFFWKVVFKHQDLGARYAHCDLGIIASKAWHMHIYQLHTFNGDIYTHILWRCIYRLYMQTYISMCTQRFYFCIWVCIYIYTCRHTSIYVSILYIFLKNKVYADTSDSNLAAQGSFCFLLLICNFCL